MVSIGDVAAFAVRRGHPAAATLAPPRRPGWLSWRERAAWLGTSDRNARPKRNGPTVVQFLAVLTFGRVACPRYVQGSVATCSCINSSAKIPESVRQRDSRAGRAEVGADRPDVAFPGRGCAAAADACSACRPWTSHSDKEESCHDDHSTSCAVQRRLGALNCWSLRICCFARAAATTVTKRRGLRELPATAPTGGQVMPSVIDTVTGPIRPEELGPTLVHEHVLFAYPGYTGRQSRWARSITMWPWKGAWQPAARPKTTGSGQSLTRHPTNAGVIPCSCGSYRERGRLNIVCSTGYYYEGQGAPHYFNFRQALGFPVEDEIYEMMVREIMFGIGNTRRARRRDQVGIQQAHHHRV